MHRLPVSMAGDFISSRWYVNSMAPITDMVRTQGASMMDVFDIYQVAYGVAITVDHGGWIRGVEFPSEEAALEFVLRWS